MDNESHLQHSALDHILLRIDIAPYSTLTTRSHPREGSCEVTWGCDAEAFDAIWGPDRYKKEISCWRQDETSLQHRQAILLVSDSKGNKCVAGTALALSNNDPYGDGMVGWIQSLAVRKSFRGKGLSKLLLSAVLARFAEFGEKEAYLLVEASNIPAISLYTASGFNPILENPDEINAWAKISHAVKWARRERHQGGRFDDIDDFLADLIEVPSKFHHLVENRMNRLLADPMRFMNPASSAFAVCGLSALFFASLRLHTAKSFSGSMSSGSGFLFDGFNPRALADLGIKHSELAGRRFTRKRKLFRQRASQLTPPSMLWLLHENSIDSISEESTNRDAGQPRKGELLADALADMTLCWILERWLASTRPKMHARQLSFSSSPYFLARSPTEAFPKDSAAVVVHENAPSSSSAAKHLASMGFEPELAFEEGGRKEMERSRGAGDLCLEPAAIVELVGESTDRSHASGESSGRNGCPALGNLRVLHTSDVKAPIQSAQELGDCLNCIFEKAAASAVAASPLYGNCSVVACERMVDGVPYSCEQLHGVILIVGKRQLIEEDNTSEGHSKGEDEVANEDDGSDGNGGGGGRESGDGGGSGASISIEGGDCGRGGVGSCAEGWDGQDLDHWFVIESLTRTLSVTSDSVQNHSTLYGGSVWNYSGNAGGMYDLSGTEIKSEEASKYVSSTNGDSNHPKGSLSSPRGDEIIASAIDAVEEASAALYGLESISTDRRDIALWDMKIETTQKKKLAALPTSSWLVDLGVSCIIAVAAAPIDAPFRLADRVGGESSSDNTTMPMTNLEDTAFGSTVGASSSAESNHGGISSSVNLEDIALDSTIGAHAGYANKTDDTANTTMTSSVVSPPPPPPPPPLPALATTAVAAEVAATTNVSDFRSSIDADNISHSADYAGASDTASTPISLPFHGAFVRPAVADDRNALVALCVEAQLERRDAQTSKDGSDSNYPVDGRDAIALAVVTNWLDGMGLAVHQKEGEDEVRGSQVASVRTIAASALTRPRSHYLLVASRTGESTLLGFGLLSWTPVIGNWLGCAAPTAEVSLFVTAAAQGKGVGESLLQSLLEGVITSATNPGEKPIRKVTAYAVTAADGTTSAVSLFRRAGFREVGLLREHTIIGEKYVDVALFERLVAQNELSAS